MDLMPTNQYALYTNEIAGYTAVNPFRNTDWQEKVLSLHLSQL